jgi:ABC-type dipeptide/oligopeptide/nickel transport system permease component
LTGYIIRRLGQTTVVTLMVTAVAFWLLHLLPGGEVHAILGIRATASSRPC